MLASLVSSSVVPPTLLLIVFHNPSPSSTHPATPKHNMTRSAPVSADATRSLEVPRKRNHHTYPFVFICKYHDQRIFFCCGNFLCRSLMHGVETLARVLNLLLWSVCLLEMWSQHIVCHGHCWKLLTRKCLIELSGWRYITIIDPVTSARRPSSARFHIWAAQCLSIGLRSFYTYR
jgi:hypothetical protein